MALKKYTIGQEASVLVAFGRQLSNAFYFIIGILRLRAINWFINEFNRRRSGRGGVGGVSTFWDLPSRIFLGHFPEIIIIYLESSAQELSIGTLYEQIGLRGGSVDMSKSQRHTCSGAGRGASQADEAAIYPKLTGLC